MRPPPDGRYGGAGDDTAGVLLTWVVLPLLGLLIVLGLAVWLAGQLSALATGHGWPAVPASDALRLGVGLLRHGGDITAAWPAAVRGRLGPAALIWTLLVAVLGLLLTAAGLVARYWLGRRGPSPVDGGARWASAAEERRIAVPDDPNRRAGRLVAGRGMRTGRLLAGEDCISAVGFGPNGSGKTTGLIAPNVLQWAGSVVMTTTKPADVALVYAHRVRLGPVWLIAPAGAPGYATAGWSPVDYATDAEHADRMAEWLVEASGLSADPKARPWLVQARKYVKPLLLAARLSGGGIDAFVDWVYAGRDAVDDVRQVLLAHGAQRAWREYHSTWTIHEEGIGSVLFTAYGLADAYSRPSVRAAAAAGGFAPEQLFGPRPGTLIVLAPESDVDRYAPLFTALLAAVVHTAETHAARTGGPVNPRLLLAMDEAGNVFRYPRVANLLTTARGNGIQLLLVYHDVAQIEQLFGRHVARTVLSNAKLRILLPGQGDLDTLRYFSELLGRARVSRSSVTRGETGRRSTSTGEQPEDLAPLHALRGLPEHVAVVQYRNLPGMRVRLRFCHADKTLRRLCTPTAEQEAS